MDRLSVLRYGVGHMLNDLTSACWFTYLLIYLTDVGLSNRQAAVVMLSGQLADGLATILVGQLIDAFGHFKWWHAGGTALVAVSFSSVFGGCLACNIVGSRSLMLQTVGYSCFAAVFNMGWAATQVSHMSLVNCLTADPSKRVAMNSCRNAFTMVANLLLYAIAFTVFAFIDGRNAHGVQIEFQWISGTAIALGICFVLIFLTGVSEPRLTHHMHPKEYNKSNYMAWFRKLLYYQVALVYMLTRLSTNVSQALLAFYLIDDLQMGLSAKAIVPAVIYVSSFAASLWLQELWWNSYRLKAFFAGGAALWILSGTAIYYLPSHLQGLIYFIAVMIGFGNALMLVTATSMEGVLVGCNLEACAFVYGSLSLLDKLACGVALYIIEAFHVKSGPVLCLVEANNCGKSLVRQVLTFVPGGCALLAAAITVMTDMDKEDIHLFEPLLPCKHSNDNFDEVVN